MPRRLLLSLVLIGLLAAPDVAFAATKNGITPTSPKAGQDHPRRQAPDHEGRASTGPGQIYVHVCKSKKKDKDGAHLHRRGDQASAKK